MEKKNSCWLASYKPSWCVIVADLLRRDDDSAWYGYGSQSARSRFTVSPAGPCSSSTTRRAWPATGEHRISRGWGWLGRWGWKESAFAWLRRSGLRQCQCPMPTTPEPDSTGLNVGSKSRLCPYTWPSTSSSGLESQPHHQPCVRGPNRHFGVSGADLDA